MNLFKYLLFMLVTGALLVACKTSTQQSTPLLTPIADGLRAPSDNQLNAVIASMTLAEKISMIHANSKFTIAGVERLGIKEMWMSDGPHGVRNEIERHSWNPVGGDQDYATYLPNLTAVAASWDREMAHLHGSVLGAEARHRGKDLILGPGVNLARLPLYGRNFEYMGEDPFLAAELAVEEIKAIQQQDVSATIKHYALNNQELNRTGVDARPSERTLREVYLPVFEAAVKEADVQAIMGAYNQFRGTNANQSKHLIRDILKDEWQYQGLVVTDWNVDINSFDAAMNGLDIEMGTNVDDYSDYFMADALLELVQQGKVPEAVIDDKVRRILRVQHRIGMYDSKRKPGARNTPEHRQHARTIASQGVVLLKNNGVLPLPKQQLKNILVMGPNADKAHGAGGGSSEVKSRYEITPLQGLRSALPEQVNVRYLRAANDTAKQAINSDYVVSRHWTGTPAWQLEQFSDENKSESLGNDWIWHARHTPEPGASVHQILRGRIKALVSGEHVFQIHGQGKVALLVNGEPLDLRTEDGGFSANLPLQEGNEYQVEMHYDGNQGWVLGMESPGELYVPEQEYLQAAQQADVVIFYGGLSHADDRESIDRTSLTLPDNQDQTIRKLLAVNPNTVVFMVAGSAVEMPWVDQAPAIVWGWYAGMEAGHAFADVLFGVVNPGGKLPITLPQKLEHSAPIALDDYHPDVSWYKEGVLIGHRWYEQQGIAPLFAFGHGLSYTTFAYSDVELSATQISAQDVMTITATITNTGERAGAEVAQLYLADPVASVPRPIKELKGFDKVYLQPGESGKISMQISKRDLSFWDPDTNEWKAEPGKFEVLLGAASDDIKLKAEFEYRP